ncbi:MAG: magnesium transporter CorA family protein [Christensenellaceae bacterium]|nr:magnesium transporter CorA family protein [Christensenellaceae bacterium]
MIKIVSTAENNTLKELTEMEKGAWIHLSDPSRAEVRRVVETLGIEEDFVKAALDEEEPSRIESENGANLIIVDIPIVVPADGSFLYETVPLGIIITETNVVTVCLEETALVEDFWNRRVKNFDTCKKTRLVLQLLYRTAGKYLQYLRQIDKASNQVEAALHKSMRNRELIQMLKLEKSLVYFSTSLKSNEVVLEKILKGNLLKRYPDDTDLLEDIIIESRQAIEMCNIYRDILSGTTEAFASVISNNLNVVMKLLTAITIIIAIPTLFSGLWGMNVANIPFSDNPNGFWIVTGISVGVAALVSLFMWRKKMF